MKKDLTKTNMNIIANALLEDDDKSSQLITGNNINLYGMMALKQRLKLEIAGMKSSGRSAYSIIKTKWKLNGNRARVLITFTNLIENKRGESNQ